MTKIINLSEIGNRKEEIVSILKNGGVILYPTDTQYGLGADATNPEAIEKIKEIKRRDPSKSISIAVSDIDMAEKFGKFSEKALELAKAHLPGPLTIIVPKIEGNLANNLSDNPEEIAIRIPDQKIILDIIKEFGSPITTTSANVSGMNPGTKIEDILAQLGEKSSLIDMVIDDGELDNPGSTIVKIVNNNVTVVRQGALRVI